MTQQFLDIISNKITKIKEFVFSDNPQNKKVLVYFSLGIAAVGGLTILSYAYRQKLYLQNPQLKMRQKMRQKIQKELQKSPNIVYLNVLKSHVANYENIEFRYNVLENLAKKPQKSDQNPFLPPYEKGLYISEIGSTHRLLFNKFQVIRGHTLVVTKKFENQGAYLSVEDFQTSLEISRVQKGFVYYNSGPNAGSSQPHKHLQVMPEKAWKDAHLLYNIKQAALSNQDKLSIFNFKHVIKNLQSLGEIDFGVQEGEYLEKMYKEGLRELDNIDLKYDYNVIFDDRFMFIVLRSQEKAFSQFAFNAMGFTGSFLFKNEDQLDKALQYSPLEMLQEITVQK